MSEGTSYEDLETKLGRINAEIINVLNRRKEEISSGESIEAIKENIIAEKKNWIENPDFSRRVTEWSPEANIEDVKAEISRNLDTAEIFLLDNDDAALVDQLHAQYTCAVQGIPVPEDFVSSSSCSFIHPDEDVPPALRSKIQMTDSGIGTEGFSSKLHHEFGHLASHNLFLNTFKNSDVPVAHSTTDPGSRDYEGYVEYLSLPVEIDVRARTAISHLSGAWNPSERLATLSEVQSIRDASRWSLPLEVRELRDHFDDAQILWIMNNMPAI